MTPDQERKLNEVHDAIVGNNLGNDGIITRLKDLEKYKRNDQKLKWTLAGVLLAFQWFLNWLTKNL